MFDTALVVAGITAITAGCAWLNPAIGAIALGACLLSLVFAAKFHKVSK